MKSFLDSSLLLNESCSITLEITMDRLGELLLSPSLAEALLPSSTTALWWGLHHPYWLIAIAIALIIFVQTVLSLLTQLVRHSFKLVGQSPLSLGRWLLSRTAFKQRSNSRNAQRLAAILTRLETLQQEQATLLGEVKTILATKES